MRRYPDPISADALDGTIEVVYATLDGATSPPVDDLDETELDRARAFRFEADRRRFVASHAAVRQVLARHLGAAPADLAFDRTCLRCGATHGKPRLAGAFAGALDFSLSHAGELATVAVTRRGEVGVDVERIDESRPVEELATRYLSRRDADALLALPAADRPLAFASVWTRTEAYLKGTGEGIVADLRLIEMDQEPDTGWRRVRRDGAADAWFVCDLPVPYGYQAAVAVAAAPMPVVMAAT